jgi:hypothetical protein
VREQPPGELVLDLLVEELLDLLLGEVAPGKFGEQPPDVLVGKISFEDLPPDLCIM